MNNFEISVCNLLLFIKKNDEKSNHGFIIKNIHDTMNDNSSYTYQLEAIFGFINFNRF